MSSSATLVTRYAVDDKFTGPSKRIVSAARDVDRELTKSKRGVAGFSQFLDRAFSGAASTSGNLAGAISNIGPVIGAVAGSIMTMVHAAVMAAGAMGALSAGVGAVGIMASRQAAEIEALRMGLQAMLGDSSKTEAAMKRLRGVAALPGLGFQEAIQGATRLMAAGFDFTAAERAMRGFGNALATVGGGKAELDGVLLALSQIAAKGKVSAEEINQIAERVPQIRQIMKNAFGTSDTEALGKMGIGSDQFIMKIISELEKLPMVTGGAKNAWENFSDTITISLAAIGDQVNGKLMPVLNRVSDWISYAVSSGAFSGFVDKIMELFGLAGSGDSLASAVDTFMAKVFAFVKNLPDIITSVINTIKAGVSMMVSFVQNLLVRFYNGLAMMAYTLADKLPLGMGRIADSVRGFGDAMVGAGAMVKNPKLIGMLMPDLTKGWEGVAAGFQGRDQSGLSSPSGGTVNGQTGEGKALTNIEKWTRQTSENTQKQIDWAASIFGGGDLGRMGVSPTELARLKGQSGRGGSVTVHQPKGPILVTDPQAYIIDILGQVGITAQRGRSVAGAR